jgi:hypothetical protein
LRQLSLLLHSSLLGCLHAVLPAPIAIGSAPIEVAREGARLLTGALAVLAAPVERLRCKALALKQHENEDDAAAHGGVSHAALSA